MFFNSFWDELAVLPGLKAWWDDESLNINIELPGYKKESISIGGENNIISISAEKPTSGNKDIKYTMNHSHFPDSYLKKLKIPMNLSIENATGEYSDGILSITIPKKEELMPLKIPIK